MAEYALPGIFVMGCLVYLMESYVIRCPEQAEWNIRAEILCQNTTTYFCLYNYITYSYEEGCTGPDWDRPGSKRVYARNFNRAACRYTRYQPIKFVTDGNSDCIFRKSLCTNEGQTLFEAGTTKTDSTCRCDYKQGYAFVTVPRNKCSCRPSEEDCSCYLKKCQGIGYNLSADYECTKNGTKKTVCPLMSENTSEDSHIDMTPTGTLREDDSYAIRGKWVVFIVVSCALFGMIVITMYIMFQQRLPRCPCLSTEQISGNNPQTTSGSTGVHAIASLTPSQNRWRIRARVTQKSDIIPWKYTNGEGKWFSVNLLDKSGEIRAIGFNDDVDKYYEMLEVNKIYFISKGTLKKANIQYNNLSNDYEMTFNADTTVELCNEDVDLPSVKFDFTKINELDSKTPGNTVAVEEHIESGRNGAGPSLDSTDQNATNDQSDNEDQIGLGKLDENQKSAAKELKDSIDKRGLDSVLKHLNEDLDNWRNEPVKLALTGKSGVGKSSFINAIRNLKPGDHGFATVSCYGNTTKQATVYEYPGNPKITLHDLPGFGTKEFPENEYEEKMGLHKYDYFLIFVRNIEESDTELANKLKKMKKNFCFVRSKLDLAIQNVKDDGESEAEVVEKMMSKSLFILENTGLKESRFFVISNRSRRIGHFNELVSYIQSTLPELKCDAVMFSLLGELTDGIIDSKYEILKKRIWRVSLASAGVSATPVPGVDVVLNVALICKEILLYHKTFGFGQKNVKDISKDKYLRKQLSASSIIQIEAASKAMGAFVIVQLGKLGTLMAVQSAFDYIFPFIGSVVSGLTAGTVTYKLLTRILNNCRDDAKLVYSHLMIVNAQK